MSSHSRPIHAIRRFIVSVTKFSFWVLLWTALMPFCRSYDTYLVEIVYVLFLYIANASCCNWTYFDLKTRIVMRKLTT